MHAYLKQSTATQTRVIGPFVDDTDFKTAETALSIANTDVKLSKNGGTAANKNSGGGTHIANGMYALTFDATDTNTVGELSGSISMTGALIVPFKFTVLEETIYDALFGASAAAFDANGRVDVAKIAGTTQTARDIGASVLLSSGTGTGQLSLSSGLVTVGTNNDKTGYSLTATTGLGNQTANITGNLSGSVGSVSGAVGSVTGAVGSVTGTVGGIAGTITTLDALDTAQDSQHSTTQSAISGLNDIAATDIVSNGAITTLAGAVVNVDTVDTCTTNSDMRGTDGANTIAPDNASIAAILTDTGITIPGTLGTPTGADLATDIANISAGSAPTAAQVANAVWTEAIADHSGVAGSTAEKLNAAGNSGDPWDQALPASYADGKAGSILGGLTPVSIAQAVTGNVIRFVSPTFTAGGWDSDFIKGDSYTASDGMVITVENWGGAQLISAASEIKLSGSRLVDGTETTFAWDIDPSNVTVNGATTTIPIILTPTDTDIAAGEYTADLRATWVSPLEVKSIIQPKFKLRIVESETTF